MNIKRNTGNGVVFSWTGLSSDSDVMKVEHAHFDGCVMTDGNGGVMSLDGTGGLLSVNDVYFTRCKIVDSTASVRSNEAPKKNMGGLVWIEGSTNATKIVQWDDVEYVVESDSACTVGTVVSVYMNDINDTTKGYVKAWEIYNRVLGAKEFTLIKGDVSTSSNV